MPVPHRSPAIPSAGSAELARQNPCRPSARISDRLADPLIDAAIVDHEAGFARAPRADGWTADTIRIFLTTLAECGVVEDAARAAGMSRMSAYRLRNSARGRAFLLAWQAALVRARRRLADDLVSRAVNGCVDLLYRDGELVAERHRFDNRLTLQVFERLGRQLGRDEVGGAVGIVAEEFEPFVEIVCRGGEGAGEFLSRRAGLAERNADETERLARAENYARYGVGLPEEIDTSDLDPEQRDQWTEEQVERHARSRVPEAGGGTAGEDVLMPLWDFQNCIPGATGPVLLPACTTVAQAPAYAYVGAGAGALNRNLRNLSDRSEPASLPAAESVAAPAAGRDIAGAIAQCAATAGDAAQPGGPEPAAVRATCAPGDYDPASGLLPPHGWVAPGR